MNGIHNKEQSMNMPIHPNMRGLGLGALLSLGLLAGCANLPDKSDTYAEAEEAVERAKEMPGVTRHAALKLQQAEESLNRAEEIWEERGDDRIEMVDHHAYLAKQQAATAIERARIAEAREEMQQVSQAREKVLREARERELGTTRQRAEQAELQAEAARERARELEQQYQAAREEAQATRGEREQENQELQELRETVQSLKAQQTERGMVLTMEEVLFDLGESELKPGGERAVQQLARFLEENPDREVLVEGYTDTTGDESFNQELSRERAEAVRQQLVTAGVERDRIEIRAHGEDYPVATNETAAGRQLNRRVEVVIGAQGDGAPEPRTRSPEQEEAEAEQQEQSQEQQ
jgi:outer membrane protein OmpA-like peptidoglycan-associated protein